jgi:hypothetical protein
MPRVLAWGTANNADGYGVIYSWASNEREAKPVLLSV